MKGGHVYRSRLTETNSDPKSLVGTWIALAGPDVPARREFTAEKTARVTTEPGSKPAAGEYALRNRKNMVIKQANGGERTYSWQVDEPLLTLDEKDGPRYILRRMP